MSTDFEDLVRARLREDTSDVEPGSTLLAEAYKVSRRLQIRRRVVVAGVTAAILVAGGLTGWAASSRHSPPAAPPIPAGPLPASDKALLTRPTKGDLAGDSSFLRQVKGISRLWTADHRVYYNGPKGKDPDISFRGLPDAHVIWAGKAAGSPAAVLAQEIVMKDGPGKWVTTVAVSCVGKGADGELAVVGPPVDSMHNVLSPGQDEPLAFFANGQHTSVVIPDVGDAVEVSLNPAFDASGISRRTFDLVQFTDGAAVFNLPAQTPGTNVLTGTPDALRFIGPTDVTNQAEHKDVDKVAQTLRWKARSRIGKPDPYWPTNDSRLEEKLIVLPNQYSIDMSLIGYAGWYLYGTTANGSHVRVQEYYTNTVAYVYAFVDPKHGKRFVVGGGKPQMSSPLPVRFKLRSNQGWVVASQGATLKYQIGNGPWLDPQHNAALYPADATAIQVTKDGQQNVVPLG